jgi:hypothetical protein
LKTTKDKELAMMDPTEIHAKAAIAAALIASHAVEIPRIPATGLDWTKDAPSVRLRTLTDYVYRTIVDNQHPDDDEAHRAPLGQRGVTPE